MPLLAIQRLHSAVFCASDSRGRPSVIVQRCPVFFFFLESLRGVCISFFRATCTAPGTAGTSRVSIAGTAGKFRVSIASNAVVSRRRGTSRTGGRLKSSATASLSSPALQRSTHKTEAGCASVHACVHLHGNLKPRICALSLALRIGSVCHEMG